MSEKKKSVNEIKSQTAENESKVNKSKKKRKGIVAGVFGVLVAAAMTATVLGATGCAHKEQNYTVTYFAEEEIENFNGGSFSVKEGTKIADLKNHIPLVDGYEVEALYKDENLEQEFKDDDRVTGDTKIYIKYREIEVTIKFYRNFSVFNNESSAGEGDIKEVKISYFNELTQSDLLEVKQNDENNGIKYTFKDWQTPTNVNIKESDLIGKTGKELLALDADGDRQLKFFANYDWEFIEYTITFDASKISVYNIIDKDKKLLTSESTVHYGDTIEIDPETSDGWVYHISSTDGLDKLNEKTYRVMDNVNIGVDGAEHKYLELSQSESNYIVDGLKAGVDSKVIKDIVIPNTHPDGNKITEIKAEAFKKNGYIESLSIGENVTSIGASAFSECVNLKSAILVNGITNIGNSAFFSCTSLTEIIIPEHVTSIGESAFSKCTMLSGITIGSGVTSIGNTAFHQCTSLTQINWNAENIKSYGSNTFEGSGKDGSGIMVTFGESVESIPANCFVGNSKIISVIIGSNVKSIGETAFHNCTNLTLVYYQGNKNDWGTISKGNTGLESVTVYYYASSDPYAVDSGLDSSDNYWYYDGDTTTPLVWERH